MQKVFKPTSGNIFRALLEGHPRACTVKLTTRHLYPSLIIVVKAPSLPSEWSTVTTALLANIRIGE
jgi:hypothetical protein